ncbi:MAG: hypothetical protein RLZZ227_160, partial [Pseudomonadota bacterium]
FILGIGLGLGSISPWSNEGISGTALGVSTILWITFVSLVASGVGGYITGRLRTRWAAVHSDEVYFRDTAHGFLSWGLATVITAVIFTSTTIGAISMGAQAAATVAGGAVDAAAASVTGGAVAGAGVAAAQGAESGGGDAGPMGYYLDSLFRTSVLTRVPANQFPVTPAATDAALGGGNNPQQQGAPAEQEAAADAAATPQGAANLTPPQQAALAAGGASPETMVTPRAGASGQGPQTDTSPTALPEVTRIFARAIANGELPQDDVTYIGRLISRHSGVTAEDAEARVTQTFDSLRGELQQAETAAREAADEARAASAKVALWFFVALLIGAFVGSLSATFGGRQRDL